MKLSFEQICPQWAKQLKNPTKRLQKNGTFVKNGELRSINTPNSCVIGEAHDWSSHYRGAFCPTENTCVKCDTLSMKFWRCFGKPSRISSGRKFNLKMINNTIKEFVGHWNYRHA